MSLEWNDKQTRILIVEHKNGNGEYHQTPKRNKRMFWEKIAEKLNEINNSNYFTGEACNKKFLSLTRAYYVQRLKPIMKELKARGVLLVNDIMRNSPQNSGKNPKHDVHHHLRI
ncbi:hypothetical protein C1646_731540 [Rhizophagus diaphanus]|nr:hypothetical protein C1646_731540 [Rhizophagus diaphanus] [Rhizophagus sp. MUCL 43196]